MSHSLILQDPHDYSLLMSDPLDAKYRFKTRRNKQGQVFSTGVYQNKGGQYFTNNQLKSYKNSINSLEGPQILPPQIMGSLPFQGGKVGAFQGISPIKLRRENMEGL